MNLAVKFVSEVSAMIDYDEIPLFRQAIIRNSLALYANGYWGTVQPFQHLQDIIQRYPMEMSVCAVQ